MQQVIKKVAIGYRDYTAKEVMKAAETSYDAFKARGGKIIVLSAAERAKWAKTMPNVAKDWAASWEKKGVPAKAVLTAHMDAMRAAKQPILRHWDKE